VRGDKMIEFQYFKGCPNADETLKNLIALKDEGFISEEIKIVNVESPEKAKELNFQGSPTILYNGYDIYTMEKPEGFAYNCRVYFINSFPTGVLPKEFIKERIKILKDKNHA
jgi:hypothetical protein